MLSMLILACVKTTIKSVFLAGPFHFGFAGLIGDLEFKRDALMWMENGRYYGKQEYSCDLCLGSSTCPTLSIYNFRRDAFNGRNLSQLCSRGPANGSPFHSLMPKHRS